MQAARCWPVGGPRAEPGCPPERVGAATSGPSIGRVLSEGRPLHGRLMVVFVAPGSGNVAFIAGRRVGGAVVRNRARRILRAAWRELAPRVREGYDIALVARAAIRGAKTQDLVAEMLELLSRAQMVGT
ncbi:MAG TPA: ribonuclease P protein component [Actinomycetota bacterium]